MAGLLYKDWLLLRRQLWYYALLLGLYLTLTAAGVLDASFLCGLAVLYGTLLPTTCFSYDEAVHWERYAAATPAGRRGTVDGKYLLALLLAALSGGISLFLTALMEGPESALSLAVLVCTGLALAVNAVNLPLLLLLGVSRSRAALYFVFILFFGVMVGANAAGGAVNKLAQIIAEQVVKKLPQQALTKGVIYPLVKKVAAQLGVSMTKKMFAGGVAKLVPAIGAVLAGGFTLATFAPMSYKLKNHLAGSPLTTTEPDPAPQAPDEPLTSG